jgi:uncharacterized protein (DUF885 family)
MWKTTEEEAKARFIEGHLKSKAWDWFEPFMRERGSKPKVEWSDRTIRVFSSYKEMSKAMIQVSGDIDERKTAARKLQQLRQTTSVRNYITEFQTITANLDWNDEALGDKFQEGLKQSTHLLSNRARKLRRVIRTSTEDRPRTVVRKRTIRRQKNGLFQQATECQER